MSEPILYTKNYVDANATILPSHGSTNIGRIHDGDQDAQYETSGADDDTTQVTIEIQFMEAGTALSRAIDRLIIVNHNFADIDLEYWNGSDWVSAVSTSGLTASTTILSFTQVTTTKIRLLVLETQVADEEKKIGLFISCALLLDVGSDFTRLEANARQKNSQFLLGDGSLQRTVVMHSALRSTKYGARVAFKYLTDVQFDALRVIKESGVAFFFQPESVNRPGDIYLVHWTSPFRWTYSSLYKDAGKELALEVKEA